MADATAAFVAKIPENTTAICPAVLRRVPGRPVGGCPRGERHARAEVACGTALSAALIHGSAGRGGHATYLTRRFRPARSRLQGPAMRLQLRTPTARALPFESGSSEAVVCQFGLMFFPTGGRRPEAFAC